jgi:hypothetical protein
MPQAVFPVGIQIPDEELNMQHFKSQVKNMATTQNFNFLFHSKKLITTI